MALLTATAISGSETAIAFSGYPGNTDVYLYRTANATIGEDVSSDLDDWGDPIATFADKSSGSYNDYDLTPGTTQYYRTSDGVTESNANVTLSVAGELQSNYTPVTLNVMDTAANRAALQNSSSYVTATNVPLVAGKKLTLIALSTENAITDAVMTAVLSAATAQLGTSPKFQIIATDSIVSVGTLTPTLRTLTKLEYL